MANETIVRISADATGYTSALERAQRSAQNFLASQDAAAARTAAAQRAVEEATTNASQASVRQINSFMQSLTRQADTAGKTRAELLQMQAAALGVSDSAKQYIDRIAEASKHTEEFSLKTAGARRELLVLAHEASQGSWKNFGGSLMVLGEKTDVMSKILSPAGLGIGAIVGALALFGKAAIDGANESAALAKALQTTGNYAGVTAGQVDALAESIGHIQGGTTEAQKVLTGLIQTGRFSGDALGSVAKSVIAMSDATGESADKVIEQYAKMSDGVAKWAEEQNKQYHFLSLAEYDHIRDLEEAGAQSAAQAQAADLLTAALSRQHDQLGWLPAAWHAVGEAAQTAWRQMMNFGKPTTAEDKLADLKQQLVSAQASLAAGGPDVLENGSIVYRSDNSLKQRIDDLKNQIANQQAFVDNEQKFAAQQAETDKIHQAAIDADNALSKSLSSLDKGYARQEEMRKLFQQFAALKKEYENTGVMPEKYQGVSFDVHTGNFSGGLYDKAVADINDRYKDKAPPRQKAYTDDASTRFLQQLRDQQAELDSQLSTTDKLTNSQKELAKFNQQISDWKGKTLTADQKSLVARQDEIRAQLKVNIGKEEEAKQQEAINKLTERSAQINASIESYQNGQREQYGRQLDAFGMGSEALKNAQAVKSIYAEYQHLKEQLDKSTDPSLIGGEKYNAEAAKIKAGLDQSLKDYDAYYDALKAKQGDWVNGFTAGVANYLDSAHNMAAQTETAFTDVMKGMEDSLTSFVTTGKFNFGSFATSVIADIARIQARAALSGLLGTAISALGGMFGNTGAAISANVSGTGLDGLINATGGWGTVPARATGGPVDGGSAYLIGEKGPELFVPGASGAVVPNHALSSIASSGGGSSNQFNITLGDSGGGGWSQQDLASLQQVLGGWMDQRMDKKMKGQGGYAWQIRNRSV